MDLSYYVLGEGRHDTIWGFFDRDSGFARAMMHSVFILLIYGAPDGISGFRHHDDEVPGLRDMDDVRPTDDLPTDVQGGPVEMLFQFDHR